MSSTKKYTPEQESAIIEVVKNVKTYQEQLTALSILGKKWDKLPRQMIAKVSSMAKAKQCNYIKKSYTAKPVKAGAKTKADIVENIAESISARYEVIETLSKANENALVLVYEFINNQVLELLSDDNMQNVIDDGAEEENEQVEAMLNAE